MTTDDHQQDKSDQADESQVGFQQAMKYGQDLANIYRRERARREELEIAHQLLSAVIASAPDGLVVLDEDFVIQQANPAFARIVERPVGDAVGHRIDEVLFADALLPALEHVARHMVSPFQAELLVTRPVKRSLLVNIARLEARRTQGWVVLLHDQSERQRLEYQKIEFMNIAAHELRTPLTTVIGYGEMLLSEITEAAPSDPETCTNFTEIIINAAYRLKSTLDEILEFTEVSQGGLRTHEVTEFKLGDLVDDIFSELASAAAGKEVELICRCPASLEMCASGALVRTAIYQLVLNGINFNRPGGYVLVEAEAAGDRAHIKVSDNGIGIPQMDLERIFQPFYQVEEHSVRRIGGLGLGLSIVGHTVKQLGGEIDVETTLEKGTTITIDLPLRSPRE
ncbi:MAG: HAMP domain-containing histidine kinase [Anaerolineae bacterium]|nr:HAMP domain-containing histidine kinase [Anaerolineae bacterium]